MLRPAELAARSSCRRNSSHMCSHASRSRSGRRARRRSTTWSTMPTTRAPRGTRAASPRTAPRRAAGWTTTVRRLRKPPSPLSHTLTHRLRVSPITCVSLVLSHALTHRPACLTPRLCVSCPCLAAAYDATTGMCATESSLATAIQTVRGGSPTMTADMLRLTGEDSLPTIKFAMMPMTYCAGPRARVQPTCTLLSRPPSHSRLRAPSRAGTPP